MTNAARIIDDMPITGVQSDQVALIWDRVAPMLEELVKPDTGHTLASVLKALQTANMQLWIIGEFTAVVITAIENRPSGQRVMTINYIVGTDMAEWLADWVALQEAFAKAHDCDAIEFAGRRGWAKALAAWPEYKTSHTVYRRGLKDG